MWDPGRSRASSARETKHVIDARLPGPTLLDPPLAPLVAAVVMCTHGVTPARLEHAQQLRHRLRLHLRAQVLQRVCAQHAVKRGVRKWQLAQICVHDIEVLSSAE